MADSLVAQVLAGRRRAIARAITLIESGAPLAQEIVARLYPHTGQAHVVGITGAPGIGKSTLVSEIAKGYRGRGMTVGIVAVDPTSPFSGGAILGDRVRMRELACDPGVFIRSMATRGHLGGLAATTSEVIRVFDAARCQIILVETVGVGQAEVDVARLVHTVVVVEAPGLGDDIQTLKAGIMEIADIFVVNKADLPGADAVVTALQMALELGARGGTAYMGHHRLEVGGPLPPDTGNSNDTGKGWQVPVIEAAAVLRGGIAELIEAIDAHREYLRNSGVWSRREKEHVEAELDNLVQHLLVRQIKEQVGVEEWTGLVEAIVSKRLDPQTAANRLLDKYRKSV